MTTKKTNVPDLAELELFERKGVLERRTTHQRLLGELREARAFDAELALERAAIDADLEKLEQRAHVERVALPTVGDDSCTMLLALRGLGGSSSALAVEQRDGRTIEYFAADCIALVPGDIWERIGPSVRRALAGAHKSRRPGEPEGPIVIEPNAKRNDLLALVPEASHPMAMSREALLENLARALPPGRTARRFYLSALESRDPFASVVVKAIRNLFVRVGREQELDATSTAAE